MTETTTAPHTAVLQWTPTVRDLERGFRARRRATRVTWLEWTFGFVLFLLFLPGAIHGIPPAVIGTVLAVLCGTGLWGYGYRWLFNWRRNPHVSAPEQIELSDSGIMDSQAGVIQWFEWSHWRALLHYRDGSLLMTSAKGNGTLLYLVRAAATTEEQWQEAARLAERHVPPHPHDKRQAPEGT